MTPTIRCKSCGKLTLLTIEDAGQWVVCAACGDMAKPPPIEQWGFLEQWGDKLDPLPDDGVLAPPREPAPPVLSIPQLQLPPETSLIVAPEPEAEDDDAINWWVLGGAAAGVFLLGLVILGIYLLARNTAAPSPVATGDAGRQHVPTGTQTGPSNIFTNPAATQPATQAIARAVEGVIDRTRDAAAAASRRTDTPTTAPLAQAQRPRRASRPPIKPIAIRHTGVTDEQIGHAIQKGVDFLLPQFQHNRLRAEPPEPEGTYYTGLNALCVYALLQAGQAIDDERLNVRGKFMKGLIDEMKRMPMDGRYMTYARAIRATALAAINRPEDRAVLRDDVAWLLKNHIDGAYNYHVPVEGVSTFDNSNSQYGLLGVWAAAEVGVEIPRAYWSAVQQHWTKHQYESGEWGYATGGKSGGGLSMTAAGLASLFVTHDYLDAMQYGATVGRDPFSPPLARGLAWLEQDDNVIRIWDRHQGYTLYGVERVGLASGFKYFGRQDWYRALARNAIARQHPYGSFGAILYTPEQLAAGQVIVTEDLVETAYYLLFLARGRHPILMNKLRFDGPWANRPRDVANLARFASREMERPLNWQVVPLDREWTDWTDSPILYLASHEAPAFTDDDLVKLRSFVEAGGLLYTQSDGASAPFEAFVADLGPRLFPASEWKDLPTDHEIYTLNYKVEPRPRLRYMSNGSRILLLHSPEDIAQHWQVRADRTKRNLFEFGVNLFIYAAGKRDLRNRLASTYLPDPGVNGNYALTLARVTHGGDWDPEPHAFVRFARWLEYQTGYEMHVDPLALDELKPAAHPVAHLTGTRTLVLNDAQTAQLRRYVEEGGVLLVDACGGSVEFATSALNLLAVTFPDARLTALPANHPLLAGAADGMEPLQKPEVRQVVEQRIGRTARLEAFAVGRGRVIFSPIDLTTGLLGTRTWGVFGYDPDYAQKLLKNILLWTADGAPMEAPKAAAADVR